jgi:acyl-coenzyme A synthetase/AMP-(fatty) acid ligase
LSYLENTFALNQARETLVNVPDESVAGALTGIDITRCVVPEQGSGWFTERHALIYDNRPAQVTYTSGTEGKPKGIVLTYSNLADAAERIIDQMGLTSRIREYVGVPVIYSFGMARVRAISAVGGQSFLPPRGFDPLEFARMLKSGEVNALSAVPTLLRLILQAPGVIRDAGKKLLWLEIGSQYMTGAEKREVRALFPNARIVQHYGLTEASRTTFLKISDVPDDLLESVGRPVGKTEVDISSDGLIRIRGPHVASWRFDGDQLLDLKDPEGWLVTSDLGHMKDGYLYYEGRADDIINSGGVKIEPNILEARISQLVGQLGNIVVAKVPDALRGDGVLVAAESTDLTVEQLHAASNDALTELGLLAGNALHVRVVPTIPRTATGKPLRRFLTEDFIREEATKIQPVTDPLMCSADVRGFFEQFFPGREISLEDSFDSMGGDSLSYIQFSIGFEDRFGPLPEGWESMTVAQLGKSTTTGEKFHWRRLESATLARAFFMICIVALHLDTFVYSRNWGAAYFLFMLCGYSVMRFQWPEISRTGKVDTLFGTIIRVAIPTFLVVALMQLLAQRLEPKPLLLISNWFDPKDYQVATEYFAEIYMQLLLLLALLLSFATVRNSLRTRPMVSCTVLIVLAMAMSWLMDQLWDTNYLYHRTPIWYLWTLAAGMLMASARSLRNCVWAFVIVTIATLMHHGLTSASGYIVSGVALLLFWPEITVPPLAKTIVAEIANSSMFMYLSHGQVKSLIIRLFHTPMPWLAFFVAIGFGVASFRVYNWVERKARLLARSHGFVSMGRST